MFSNDMKTWDNGTHVPFLSRPQSGQNLLVRPSVRDWLGDVYLWFDVWVSTSASASWGTGDVNSRTPERCLGAPPSRQLPWQTWRLSSATPKWLKQSYRLRSVGFSPSETVGRGFAHGCDRVTCAFLFDNLDGG